MYQERLQLIRGRVRTHGADAVLLTFLPDVRWACGFTGSNALLLIPAEGDAHFVTDGRYGTQAEAEVRGATIHVPGYRLFEHLVEQHLLPAGPVLVQGDHVTVSMLQAWREQAPGVTWQVAQELLVDLVARKSAEEVERIRAAQAITEAVFEDLMGLLRPGLTERDVAAEIVHGHLRRGAERMSFEPIVASGPNGALPHARPSDRALQRGDLVVIDMGGVRDGYASDMTRTVALGEPDAEARRVYEVVRAAQEAAIGAAHAGIAAHVLDAAARDVIAAAGYGEQFSHSLGHGIGLQTHEWPKVSYAAEYPLPEGAAVTIEPGIYLPGRFGVRIEDIVVLEAGGCRNLTRAPKELLVL